MFVSGHVYPFSNTKIVGNWALLAPVHWANIAADDALRFAVLDHEIPNRWACLASFDD